MGAGCTKPHDHIVEVRDFGGGLLQQSTSSQADDSSGQKPSHGKSDQDYDTSASSSPPRGRSNASVLRADDGPSGAGDTTTGETSPRNRNPNQGRGPLRVMRHIQEAGGGTYEVSTGAGNEPHRSPSAPNTLGQEHATPPVSNQPPLSSPTTSASPRRQPAALGSGDSALNSPFAAAAKVATPPNRHSTHDSATMVEADRDSARAGDDENSEMGGHRHPPGGTQNDNDDGEEENARSDGSENPFMVGTSDGRMRKPHVATLPQPTTKTGGPTPVSAREAANSSAAKKATIEKNPMVVGVVPQQAASHEAKAGTANVEDSSLLTLILSREVGRKTRRTNLKQLEGFSAANAAARKEVRHRKDHETATALYAQERQAALNLFSIESEGASLATGSIQNSANTHTMEEAERARAARRAPLNHQDHNYFGDRDDNTSASTAQTLHSNQSNQSGKQSSHPTSDGNTLRLLSPMGSKPATGLTSFAIASGGFTNNANAPAHTIGGTTLIKGSEAIDTKLAEADFSTAVGAIGARPVHRHHHAKCGHLRTKLERLWMRQALAVYCPQLLSKRAAGHRAIQAAPTSTATKDGADTTGVIQDLGLPKPLVSTEGSNTQVPTMPLTIKKETSVSLLQPHHSLGHFLSNKRLQDALLDGEGYNSEVPSEVARRQWRHARTYHQRFYGPATRTLQAERAVQLRRRRQVLWGDHMRARRQYADGLAAADQQLQQQQSSTPHQKPPIAKQRSGRGLTANANTKQPSFRKTIRAFYAVYDSSSSYTSNDENDVLYSFGLTEQQRVQSKGKAASKQQQQQKMVLSTSISSKGSGMASNTNTAAGRDGQSGNRRPVWASEASVGILSAQFDLLARAEAISLVAGDRMREMGPAQYYSQAAAALVNSEDPSLSKYIDYMFPATAPLRQLVQQSKMSGSRTSPTLSKAISGKPKFVAPLTSTEEATGGSAAMSGHWGSSSSSSSGWSGGGGDGLDSSDSDTVDAEGAGGGTVSSDLVESVSTNANIGLNSKSKAMRAKARSGGGQYGRPSVGSADSSSSISFSSRSSTTTSDSESREGNGVTVPRHRQIATDTLFDKVSCDCTSCSCSGAESSWGAMDEDDADGLPSNPGQPFVFATDEASGGSSSSTITSQQQLGFYNTSAAASKMATTKALQMMGSRLGRSYATAYAQLPVTLRTCVDSFVTEKRSSYLASVRSTSGQQAQGNGGESTSNSLNGSQKKRKRAGLISRSASSHTQQDAKAWPRFLRWSVFRRGAAFNRSFIGMAAAAHRARIAKGHNGYAGSSEPKSSSNGNPLMPEAAFFNNFFKQRFHALNLSSRVPFLENYQHRFFRIVSAAELHKRIIHPFAVDPPLLLSCSKDLKGEAQDAGAVPALVTPTSVEALIAGSVALASTSAALKHRSKVREAATKEDLSSPTTGDTSHLLLGSAIAGHISAMRNVTHSSTQHAQPATPRYGAGGAAYTSSPVRRTANSTAGMFSPSPFLVAAASPNSANRPNKKAKSHARAQRAAAVANAPQVKALTTLLHQLQGGGAIGNTNQTIGTNPLTGAPIKWSDLPQDRATMYSDVVRTMVHLQGQVHGQHMLHPSQATAGGVGLYGFPSSHNTDAPDAGGGRLFGTITPHFDDRNSPIGGDISGGVSGGPPLPTHFMNTGSSSNSGLVGQAHLGGPLGPMNSGTMPSSHQQLPSYPYFHPASSHTNTFVSGNNTSMNNASTNIPYPGPANLFVPAPYVPSALLTETTERHINGILFRRYGLLMAGQKRFTIDFHRFVTVVAPAILRYKVVHTNSSFIKEARALQENKANERAKQAEAQQQQQAALQLQQEQQRLIMQQQQQAAALAAQALQQNNAMMAQQQRLPLYAHLPGGGIAVQAVGSDNTLIPPHALPGVLPNSQAVMLMVATSANQPPLPTLCYLIATPQTGFNPMHAAAVMNPQQVAHLHQQLQVQQQQQQLMLVQQQQQQGGALSPQQQQQLFHLQQQQHALAVMMGGGAALQQQQQLLQLQPPRGGPQHLPPLNPSGAPGAGQQPVLVLSPQANTAPASSSASALAALMSPNGHTSQQGSNQPPAPWQVPSYATVAASLKLLPSILYLQSSDVLFGTTRTTRHGVSVPTRVAIVTNNSRLGATLDRSFVRALCELASADGAAGAQTLFEKYQLLAAESTSTSACPTSMLGGANSSTLSFAEAAEAISHMPKWLRQYCGPLGVARSSGNSHTDEAAALGLQPIVSIGGSGMIMAQASHRHALQGHQGSQGYSWPLPGILSAKQQRAGPSSPTSPPQLISSGSNHPLAFASPFYSPSSTANHLAISTNAHLAPHQRVLEGRIVHPHEYLMPARLGEMGLRKYVRRSVQGRVLASDEELSFLSTEGDGEDGIAEVRRKASALLGLLFGHNNSSPHSSNPTAATSGSADISDSPVAKLAEIYCYQQEAILAKQLSRLSRSNSCEVAILHPSLLRKRMSGAERKRRRALMVKEPLKRAGRHLVSSAAPQPTSGTAGLAPTVDKSTAAAKGAQPGAAQPSSSSSSDKPLFSREAVSVVVLSQGGSALGSDPLLAAWQQRHAKNSLKVRHSVMGALSGTSNSASRPTEVPASLLAPHHLSISTAPIMTAAAMKGALACSSGLEGDAIRGERAFNAAEYLAHCIADLTIHNEHLYRNVGASKSAAAAAAAATQQQQQQPQKGSAAANGGGQQQAHQAHTNPEVEAQRSISKALLTGVRLGFMRAVEIIKLSAEAAHDEATLAARRHELGTTHRPRNSSPMMGCGISTEGVGDMDNTGLEVAPMTASGLHFGVSAGRTPNVGVLESTPPQSTSPPPRPTSPSARSPPTSAAPRPGTSSILRGSPSPPLVNGKWRKGGQNGFRASRPSAARQRLEARVVVMQQQCRYLSDKGIYQYGLLHKLSYTDYPSLMLSLLIREGTLTIATLNAASVASGGQPATVVTTYYPIHTHSNSGPMPGIGSGGVVPSTAPYSTLNVMNNFNAISSASTNSSQGQLINSNSANGNGFAIVPATSFANLGMAGHPVRHHVITVPNALLDSLLPSYYHHPLTAPGTVTDSCGMQSGLSSDMQTLLGVCLALPPGAPPPTAAAGIGAFSPNGAHALSGMLSNNNSTLLSSPQQAGLPWGGGGGNNSSVTAHSNQPVAPVHPGLQVPGQIAMTETALQRAKFNNHAMLAKAMASLVGPSSPTSTSTIYIRDQKLFCATVGHHTASVLFNISPLAQHVVQNALNIRQQFAKTLIAQVQMIQQIPQAYSSSYILAASAAAGAPHQNRTGDEQATGGEQQHQQAPPVVINMQPLQAQLRAFLFKGTVLTTLVLGDDLRYSHLASMAAAAAAYNTSLHGALNQHLGGGGTTPRHMTGAASGPSTQPSTAQIQVGGMSPQRPTFSVPSTTNTTPSHLPGTTPLHLPLFTTTLSVNGGASTSQAPPQAAAGVAPSSLVDINAFKSQQSVVPAGCSGQLFVPLSSMPNLSMAARQHRLRSHRKSRHRHGTSHRSGSTSSIASSTGSLASSLHSSSSRQDSIQSGRSMPLVGENSTIASSAAPSANGSRGDQDAKGTLSAAHSVSLQIPDRSALRAVNELATASKQAAAWLGVQLAGSTFTTYATHDCISPNLKLPLAATAPVGPSVGIAMAEIATVFSQPPAPAQSVPPAFLGCNPPMGGATSLPALRGAPTTSVNSPLMSGYLNTNTNNHGASTSALDHNHSNSEQPEGSRPPSRSTSPHTSSGQRGGIGPQTLMPMEYVSAILPVVAAGPNTVFHRLPPHPYPSVAQANSPHSAAAASASQQLQAQAVMPNPMLPDPLFVNALATVSSVGAVAHSVQSTCHSKSSLSPNNTVLTASTDVWMCVPPEEMSMLLSMLCPPDWANHGASTNSFLSVMAAAKVDFGSADIRGAYTYDKRRSYMAASSHHHRSGQTNPSISSVSSQQLAAGAWTPCGLGAGGVLATSPFLEANGITVIAEASGSDLGGSASSASTAQLIGNAVPMQPLLPHPSTVTPSSGHYTSYYLSQSYCDTFGPCDYIKGYVGSSSTALRSLLETLNNTNEWALTAAQASSVAHQQQLLMTSKHVAPPAATSPSSQGAHSNQTTPTRPTLDPTSIAFEALQLLEAFSESTVTALASTTLSPSAALSPADRLRAHHFLYSVKIMMAYGDYYHGSGEGHETAADGSPMTENAWHWEELAELESWLGRTTPNDHNVPTSAKTSFHVTIELPSIPPPPPVHVRLYRRFREKNSDLTYHQVIKPKLDEMKRDHKARLSDQTPTKEQQNQAQQPPGSQTARPSTDPSKLRTCPNTHGGDDFRNAASILSECVAEEAAALDKILLHYRLIRDVLRRRRGNRLAVLSAMQRRLATKAVPAVANHPLPLTKFTLTEEAIASHMAACEQPYEGIELFVRCSEVSALPINNYAVAAWANNNAAPMPTAAQTNSNGFVHPQAINSAANFSAMHSSSSANNTSQSASTSAQISSNNINASGSGNPLNRLLQRQTASSGSTVQVAPLANNINSLGGAADVSGLVGSSELLLRSGAASSPQHSRMHGLVYSQPRHYVAQVLAFK